MKTSRLLGLVVAAMISLGAMASPEMTYTPQATTFKVVTLGAAQGVTLRLYDQGTGGKARKSLKMTAKPIADGNLEWTATVTGNLKGKFYTFDVRQGSKSLGETPGILLA